MNAYAAWATVTVAVFMLIGFAVFTTHSLMPLWLAILPFFISIKSGNSDKEPE